MTTWKQCACYLALGTAISVVFLQISLFLLLEKVEHWEVASDGLPHSNGDKSQYKTGDVVHERWKYTGGGATGEVERLVDVESDEAIDEDNFYHNFVADRVVTGLENRTEYAIKNNLPILMWWTKFTRDKGVVKRCSLGDCYFTELRRFQTHPQTKVFFFYGSDLSDSDLPLPRKGHHEWALLHEESPKNSFLYSYEDMITLFNHTCTFKQESDYPIPTQYLESIDTLLQPSNYTFKEKEAFGLAPIVYLQSGCNPPSDRDAFVNEMMKYIRIDSYGKCLRNKEIDAGLDDPLKMHEQVQRDFLAKYKFVLAFENAICKDYITEKLWNPMYGGAVPIYKGAPNILEWVPDHSIIPADKFQNPKELAEFIKVLANDETKYEKYREYKKVGVRNEKLLTTMKKREWGINHYDVLSFITGFECFVCDRIHANRIKESKNETLNVYQAKLEHYGCPRPVLYPYDTPPNTHKYERDTWPWDYDNSAIKATEFREKVFGKKPKSKLW